MSQRYPPPCIDECQIGGYNLAELTQRAAARSDRSTGLLVPQAQQVGDV